MSTLPRRGHALHLLHQMVRIRRFEERAAELYSAGKIRGFLHLYIGEEAVAAGALRALGPEDALLCTYREHGHALVRGVPMGKVMAEMFGKQEGCSRGRGGSMHLFDAEHRLYGGNAIVAGHLPLAVGMGLGDQLADRPRVTACFFGEGAIAEGEFHEAMNLAALWRLPVLFACENNGYAMGTALARSESQPSLCVKAASYGMPAVSVDGMDVVEVETETRRVVDAIRASGGPAFIEYRTYRFRAHSMFDAELYRDKHEVELHKKRDPIATFVARMVEADLLAPPDLAHIEEQVAEELAEAVAFAEAGSFEPVEELTRDVYTPPVAVPGTTQTVPGTTQTVPGTTQSVPGTTQSVPGTSQSVPGTATTYREAVRMALREAMSADPRVFLMGEDVGRYGGSYACSMGLLEEFGEARIRDTPLSESGFVGAGIGAALVGMRPIVEVMTVNFSLLALDQIINNAATLRHMSGGQVSVPVVIRMATGAGKQLAAQHSHSWEAIYAHVPGLKVCSPATAVDARGMLLAALEDPDPVVIFEHSGLYNRKGEMPDPPPAVDLASARVARPGTDVSLITHGGCLWRTLEAAEALAEQGVSAEVIDLRMLRPVDWPTVLASVHRTHRAVIVDEGWKSWGYAAELSARIAEEALWSLDAPVQRVAGVEVPIPYAHHLEQASIPQVADVVRAALRAVGRG